MYADRMKNLKPSFIREILNVIGNEKVISFAGGLPNPDFFPLQGIEHAAVKVSGQSRAMQYSITEGHPELRKYIAKRYYADCGFDENNIIMTNGSQQALDLLGKLFLNKDDRVVIEAPGYLGAIQAFSVYEPHIIPVKLDNDGMDVSEFSKALQQEPKFVYTVPNFQNPSGISYTEERKAAILNQLKLTSSYLIEDNPYGELRYDQTTPTRFIDMDQNQVVSLGSFSKIFVPSMRLGWVAAKKEVIDQLGLLKQAADLHTNYYSQCILYTYLEQVDLDEHIGKIKQVYQLKLETMLASLDKYMPTAVSYTRPCGGMFIWVTLPEQIDAFDLLAETRQQGVLFVPGSEFFVDQGGKNTMRLNYTNSTEEEIEQGIKIVADSINQLLAAD